MPKVLHAKLKRTAQKRGYSKERADKYIYGTMRKTGWVPSHQKKKLKRRKRGRKGEN